MSKKKVSITEVARRAGVSITTVSRVINKVPTVDKKNIAKVEEAIAHFKYKPNISAQRLAKGLNNAVGLVMPGYPGIFHSFYAMEIIRGVGHACETLRLDMVFHITDGYNLLNTNNVGGVIFADIIENRKQIESVLEDGIPCMVINNIVKDLDVNYLAVNNEEGGFIATEYLIQLGHKRIATITGNINTQAGKDRFLGFERALKKHKIQIPPEYIYNGDYSRRSAREAGEKFLLMKDRPTAVFAASDDMALEFIALCLERGIKVPQDMSVIGFDDNPAGLYSSVALTTIKQPLYDMAVEAVKSLNNIVQGRKNTPVKKNLIPTLIVRDSCAQCR